jgi:hypothetical protein
MTRLDKITMNLSETRTVSRMERFLESFVTVTLILRKYLNKFTVKCVNCVCALNYNYFSFSFFRL